MSAFTTPSRTSTAGGAALAAQRGGSGGASSGRRVVRSALELLMDTATPELPGRGGQSSGAQVVPADTSKASRRSTARAGVAPSLSPFSVTYAAAAPSAQSPSAARSSSNTAPRERRSSTSTAAPSLSQASSAHPHGTAAAGAAVAPSKSLTATQAPKEEPSALAFLSPQGKARRGVSSSAAPLLEGSKNQQHRRQQQQQQRRSHADFGDNDDMEDSELHTSRRIETKALRRRPAQRMDSPAPAPASPSRSLYSDVEAAQQSSQQEQRMYIGFDKPLSPENDMDTSFVEDNDYVSEEAVLPYESDLDERDVDVDDEGEEEKPTNGMVSATEVKALISAALRRYEKERDAEEEAVLQQVSAEVEEQATRYAALLEAYNSACTDNEELRAKLTTSHQTCREVEEALQSARQTQQAQRESMKRLEVELYHARDAQAHTQEQQRAHLQSESAEWEAVRRRQEKRHATLEAQLSQLREELGEKVTQIADLTSQLDRQEDEVSALRHQTSQREAAAEDEYKEIHQRMLRLAQNMSTMETTLRERDDAIVQLRTQLAEATSSAQRDQQREVCALEKEKAKMEEELATTRAALQRQTDDVRKRMHRLAFLEQQKDVLKSAVAEARQALSTSADEQAAVVRAMEGLLEEVQRRTAKHRPAVKRTDAPRPTRSQSPTATDADGESNSAGAPHPDDTLVYDDDDREEITGDALSCGYSDVSEEHPSASMTSTASDNPEEEEDDFYESDDNSVQRIVKTATKAAKSKKGVAQHRETQRSFSTPKRPQQRQNASSAAISTRARTTPAQLRSTALASQPATKERTQRSTSPSGPHDKESPSVKRLAQLLHHNVARAQVMMRDLQRRVVALATKRTTSPVRSVSHVSSVNTNGTSTRQTIASNSFSAELANTRENRQDMIVKLEQACRYLKSQLASATSQLGEAQAECQWRTLSMKKWEDDVQTARRELLTLEKVKLATTTEKEALELVKLELEEQLAESRQACAAAQSALEEMQAAQKSTQQELKEATSRRAAAEAALEKERAKTARLSANVTALTTSEAALKDELDVVVEKHKTTLAQLQTFRAHEATQQVKDQQELRSRSSELAELRTTVAQLRVGEGAWEAERARLQAVVAQLQRSAESVKAEWDAGQRHRAALEAEVALQADLERTTLLTIAHIVGASPSAWQTKDGSTPRASAAGDGGLSPTEKKLFDADEPSVEEIVVEEADRDAVAAVVRKRLQRHPKATTTASRLNASSVHATRAPSQPASGKRRNTAAATSRLASSPSPCPPSTHAAEAEESAAQLTRLRHNVVAAVQCVALELARLRAPSANSRTCPPTGSASPPVVAAVRASSTASSSAHSPHISGHFTSTTAVPAAERESDGAAETAWFGAASKRETSPSARVSPSPLLQGEGVGLRERGGLPAPAASSTAHTPQLQRPSTGTTQRLQTHSTPQRQHVYASSPTSSAGGDSVLARRQREVARAASTVQSSALDHLYNISPWTPSRGQWSPSASPPTAAAKAWSEVRRSVSTEDGLSGCSHSGTRGDVDGSGSPARPPSLRAPSLTH